MPHYWILVADKSQARVYRRNRPSNGLNLVQTLEHPEGRLRDRDIKSDRPGRTLSPRGTPHHAFSPHMTPEERKAFEFAHEIADLLNHGRSKNEYEKIILVAGPQMLGMIRDAMTEPCLKLVAKSITKDLSHQNDTEVAKAISKEPAELDQIPE